MSSTEPGLSLQLALTMLQPPMCSRQSPQSSPLCKGSSASASNFVKPTMGVCAAETASEGASAGSLVEHSILNALPEVPVAADLSNGQVAEVLSGVQVAEDLTEEHVGRAMPQCQAVENLRGAFPHHCRHAILNASVEANNNLEIAGARLAAMQDGHEDSCRNRAYTPVAQEQAPILLIIQIFFARREYMLLMFIYNLNAQQFILVLFLLSNHVICTCQLVWKTGLSNPIPLGAVVGGQKQGSRLFILRPHLLIVMNTTISTMFQPLQQQYLLLQLKGGLSKLLREPIRRFVRIQPCWIGQNIRNF